MERLASIIIPTYNRSALLLRTLDSIKKQQYRPIEIIVVDDGSTDDTAIRVEQWAAHNAQPQLSVLSFYQENHGPAACRNVGLQKSSGAYIYFLDSDDSIHKNLLEDAIQVLEADNSDCVIFGFDLENHKGHKTPYLPPQMSAIDAFLEGSLWGYTSSSLKRRDLVQRIGLWNESLRVAEDYEYLGRSLLQSSKSSVLRECLLTVFQSEDSLGSQKNTDMGLSHRLVAEASIVHQLQLNQSQFSSNILNRYTGRLFKTAVNMYAKGESDFAKSLGLLAGELNVNPQSVRHKLTRLAWAHGRWSSWMLHAITRFYINIKKSNFQKSL